jgi:hypothetical protein
MNSTNNSKIAEEEYQNVVVRVKSAEIILRYILPILVVGIGLLFVLFRYRSSHHPPIKK